MIAENLKRIRKEKGLTQRALSTKSGIAEITIRNYEAGKYKPKMDKLLKIANALGTTASEIFGETLHELVLPAWIPCSERLPEEKKEVLISADGDLYIAILETINGELSWSEVIEYRNVTDVDAWMPLPEPYKEGNDDNSGETE